MPVYVVTGKLGGGKTLACVGRIREYLQDGRKVATNLDLNLEKLVGNYAKKPIVYRVPNRPLASDLDGIGLGYDGDFIGEEKNGALVLDECGSWFNSRDWNAAGRKELLDWVIHARKKRWDVFFIIQDLEVMDKQARLMFAEHVVYCRRTDRFAIPLVSTIYKAFMGKQLPLPKVHIGFVKYGDTQNASIVDRWIYRGTDLYECYDTTQEFTENENGLFQYMPPFLTKGRYTSPKEDFKNALSNYKVKGFHFFLTGALTAALGVNAAITVLPDEPKKGLWGCNDTYLELYGSCTAKPLLKTLKEDLELLKKGSPVATINEKGETINEPDHQEIYITGSVKSTIGFDYLFTKNDVPFDPWLSGSNITWISQCKALIDGIKVTCKPFAEESWTNEDANN